MTTSHNTTPQLIFTIKAPLEAVWRALRNKEQLLQWHGWETPGLEEEIDSIYFTETQEEAAEENRRTFIAHGGDTFKLEAGKNATTLILVRAGLSGNAEWDAYYDNITEGWISFIEQLRFMLERAPKTPRKALFATQALDRDKILEQLNLTDISEITEGSRFTGSFQGDQVSGEVWFNTANQLGLVVDEWGPGLLILQFSEKAYIATTYGR